MFSQNSVKFLGQIVDQNGIKPDPEKVNAIACMAEPTNVSEIRRVLGMVNQHSKFSPKLAELTKPLRDLLSKKNQWMWGQKQKDAFNIVHIRHGNVSVQQQYGQLMSEYKTNILHVVMSPRTMITVIVNTLISVAVVVKVDLQPNQ